MSMRYCLPRRRSASRLLAAGVACCGRHHPPSPIFLRPLSAPLWRAKPVDNVDKPVENFGCGSLSCGQTWGEHPPLCRSFANGPSPCRLGQSCVQLRGKTAARKKCCPGLPWGQVGPSTLGSIADLSPNRYTKTRAFAPGQLSFVLRSATSRWRIASPGSTRGSTQGGRCAA